jgi:hypothetical protein
MPKGVRFCSVERQVAARAYRIATENAIKGADQKLASFEADVYRHVRRHMPPGNHPGQYCERSASNIVRFIKGNILNDIQKFGASLRLIKSGNPTGNVSDKDIHCMAIANHQNKCIGINYNYTTFGKLQFDPIATWDNYLAWLELKDCPKFLDSPSTTITTTHATKMNSNTNVTGKVNNHHALEVLENDNENDDYTTTTTTTTKFNYGDDVESVPSSFAGSAKKSDGTRSQYGIKKTKLELKKQSRDVDVMIKINGVKNEVQALNATHQQMLCMMQSSMKKQDDLEILKLLKIKYKAIRSIDKVKANAIKILIAQKTDDILQNYEDDNKQNNIFKTPVIMIDDNNNIPAIIIASNENDTSLNMVDLYDDDHHLKENVNPIINKELYNEYEHESIVSNNNNGNVAINIINKEVNNTNDVIRELKRKLHESNNNINLLTNNMNK